MSPIAAHFAHKLLEDARRERDEARRRVEYLEDLFFLLEGISPNGELLPTKEKALEYIASLESELAALRRKQEQA